MKQLQTYDRLFHVEKAKTSRTKATPELPLTPRPGEPLRWCAHDRKLHHALSTAEIHATLSPAARAFLRDLGEARTVTFEQVCWLRGLARRVSFANAKALASGRRAMTLDEPPSSKG